MTWVLLSTELNTLLFKKTAADEDEGLTSSEVIAACFTARMSLILVQEENLTSIPTVSLTFRLSIPQHAAQTNSINQYFKQLKHSTISDKIN